MKNIQFKSFFINNWISSANSFTNGLQTVLHIRMVINFMAALVKSEIAGVT
jgi:hypothetical protein